MFSFVIDLLRPWQFKGKARLLRRLVPAQGIRSARVHGYRMELDLGEHIQRMIYLGAYERHETRWIRRQLRAGMTFVDIGANVGYFTLLAAGVVGRSGRVIAIEPSDPAADKLEKVVVDNRLTWVNVERYGLGRMEGEQKLSQPSPHNHTPSMIGKPDRPGRKVRVRALDDCLADWQLQTIDLLKMDVEGFEPEVIAGASDCLQSGRVRNILCEFNDSWLRQNGSSGEQLYKQLLDFGFLDVDGDPPPMTGQTHNRRFVHR